MFFPTDAGDRLLANLRSGTPSLCAYVFSHPNLVEVAGLAGIDCFMADMMFTALDWEQRARSHFSDQAASKARYDVAIRFNMFHRPAL